MWYGDGERGAYSSIVAMVNGGNGKGWQGACGMVMAKENGAMGTYRIATMKGSIKHCERE